MVFHCVQLLHSLFPPILPTPAFNGLPSTVVPRLCLAPVGWLCNNVSFRDSLPTRCPVTLPGPHLISSQHSHTLKGQQQINKKDTMPTRLPATRELSFPLPYPILQFHFSFPGASRYRDTDYWSTNVVFFFITENSPLHLRITRYKLTLQYIRSPYNSSSFPGYSKHVPFRMFPVGGTSFLGGTWPELTPGDLCLLTQRPSWEWHGDAHPPPPSHVVVAIRNPFGEKTIQNVARKQTLFIQWLGYWEKRVNNKLSRSA